MVTAAGCQEYRSAPLDPAAHRVSWEARDPSSAEVAAYARELNELAAGPIAPFDPKDGLNLREAEAVALFFNPTLRVARLKARVPVVGAREAGRWADPELSVDGERIIEGVEHPWVLGGLISFTIPLSGRLAVEKARALAEADVEQLRAWSAEADVVAELRAQWVRWSASRRRVNLLGEYVKGLDELVTRAQKLADLGEVSATDVRPFRIERASRQVEARALELEHRRREVAIKGLMGLTPDAPVSLVPSLPAPTQMTAPQQRQWVEQNSPKLAVARAEYTVAERALESEIRRQYPDLAVGAGPGTEDGQSRVLFGLGIPIPVLNRNARGIAEARASRDVARASSEGLYEELVGRLAGSDLAVAAARATRESLERDVVPLADEQVAELQRLGKLGDFNTLLVLDAVKTAFDAKAQLLDAAIKEAEATNELDALGGLGLTPQPTGQSRTKP